jgi:hypothetical protein
LELRSTVPIIRDLSLDDVISKMREVAEEFPDQAISNCFYFHADGSPACIVGQALHRLGFEAHHIAPVLNTKACNTLFGWGDFSRYTYYVGDLAESSDNSPEMLKKKWIASVQKYQDTGSTWGSAVESADAWLAQRSLLMKEDVL